MPTKLRVYKLDLGVVLVKRDDYCVLQTTNLQDVPIYINTIIIVKT